MSELRIHLTVAQAAAAEWALEPMEDYFAGLVEDGELAEVPPLPRVEGRVLIFTPDPDVVEDLRYRLTEQLPDMAEGRMAGERDTTRSAANLWKRIAAAAAEGDQPA